MNLKGDESFPMSIKVGLVPGAYTELIYPLIKTQLMSMLPANRDMPSCLPSSGERERDNQETGPPKGMELFRGWWGQSQTKSNTTRSLVHQIWNRWIVSSFHLWGHNNENNMACSGLDPGFYLFFRMLCVCMIHESVNLLLYFQVVVIHHEGWGCNAHPLEDK